MTEQSTNRRYDNLYAARAQTINSATLPTGSGTRDGDTARVKILAASTGADADVWWNLTYEAATGYWNVAGPPMTLFKAAGDTTASLTYVSPATVQTINAPYAGDYLISISANTANNTGGDGVLVSYIVGATAANDQWSIGGANLVNVFSGRPYYLHTGVLQSDTISLRIRAFTGGTATVADRILNVLPLRIR